MTANTKRISVTLSREHAEFLETASKALDKSQGAIIRELLDQGIPMLKGVIKHLTAAKRGEIDRAQLMSRILKETMQGVNAAQVDLLDTFDSGEGEQG